MNAGSLEKDIVEKHGWPTAEGMVESAERHIRFLEDEGYREIKVSLKAHDVAMTVRGQPALLAAASTTRSTSASPRPARSLAGTVKSAAGLGILLGRRHRRHHPRLAHRRSRSRRCGSRACCSSRSASSSAGATLTSCPTCGRCSVDMIPIAERVEQRLSTLKGEVTVAVMGCEVNGPGEAAAADVGVAYGHNGVGLLFRTARS